MGVSRNLSGTAIANSFLVSSYLFFTISPNQPPTTSQTIDRVSAEGRTRTGTELGPEGF